LLVTLTKKLFFVTPLAYVRATLIALDICKLQGMANAIVIFYHFASPTRRIAQVGEGDGRRGEEAKW